MITQIPLFHWPFSRYRLLQIGLLFVFVISVLLRVFPLEIQKRIVNTAIGTKDAPLLIRLSLLYIALTLASGLFKYAANVLQKDIGQRIVLEIRNRLYIHILSLPLGFFRKTAPGTVITALTAELNAIGFFIGGAAVVPLVSLFTLFAFAFFMFRLNPTLALISISVYPIEMILLPILQNRHNRLNAQRILMSREISDVVGEAVSGIHEIQGNAAHRIEQRKLGEHFTRLYHHLMRMFVLKYGIKFVNNVFQNIGPFLLFLIGGLAAIRGEFSLGALVAFLSAYEKLYDPWKELIEYYQEFQDARVRYRRVMERFDAKPEYELDDASPSAETAAPFQGRIEVSNLGYTVENRIRILDRISFGISPGETTALVGFSGSGKSTLAMILAQLYRYNEGQVQIDGRELTALPKTRIGRNVGFVSQHPFIFNDTIRENLLYGFRARVDAENNPPHAADIFEAVTTVGLADDIVRTGLNAVPPATGLDAERILAMRRLVHRRLADRLRPAVEFYHFRRFQEYLRIYTNLIFCYPKNESYRLENAARNRMFLSFLEKTELKAPLTQLGLQIARETVSLLNNLGDSDYFFINNPIGREELETYRAAVRRADAGKPGAEDEAALLTAAFRYIPALHKTVALTEDMRKKILWARRRFIHDFGGFDPDECAIDISEIISDESREQTRPVNEDFPFFCPTHYIESATVMENILFGELKTDDPAVLSDIEERIVDLLKKEDLILQLVEIGLDFAVGTKGDRLSGGQRQKIAIARTLLKRPDIYIFDEATASLDNTSQARIQDLIENRLKGNRTVVSVAHRLDTIKNYDTIIVLKAGRIAERGTYDELMKKKGVFYHLAENR